MKKIATILILIFIISCQKENSIIRDNISIELSPYQDGGVMKASALPVLNEKSELMAYKRRFEYLLMNVPELHQPGKSKERDSINKLYPDTTAIKRLYLEAYCRDQKLTGYFEEAYAPVKNPDLRREKNYTVDELMDVASKFFYCDQVNPDTSIQMHVCIGINGQHETKWKKDYTLLAAFCYEAIFSDLDNDDAGVRNAYVSEKNGSCERFRKNITTLDKYLEDVKLDLFDRMKNNATLKEKLLAYYELNKNNLPFKIMQGELTN